MVPTVDRETPIGPPITIFCRRSAEAFRKRHRIQPDDLRRVKFAYCQLLESAESALTRFGPELVHDATNFFDWNHLQVLSEHRSAVDDSSKIVLQTRSGDRIETVLLQAATSRTSVCVSTQVGCRAGCTFCATARMGLRRNLHASEIVDQVRIAAQRSLQRGRRLRNVVFMGMGEPLHNEAGLHQAIEWLLDQQLFAFPPRKITVSTVGEPVALRHLVDRFPGIQIAVSLHSADPKLRTRLVPWTRQTDWDELRDTIRWISRQPRSHRHQGPIMIEHIMIEDVNDSLEDAQKLCTYLDGAFCIINLIPFNPIPYVSQWRPTPRPKREAFANYLRQAGYFTTIRYSMGGDVGAACGQLVQSPAIALPST